MKMSKMTEEAGRKIAEGVATAYGLTVAELLDHSPRTAAMCQVRFIVYYLLTRVVRLSTPQAGQICRRCHATIIQGCRALQNWMDTEPALKTEVTVWVERAKTMLEKEGL